MATILPTMPTTVNAANIVDNANIVSTVDNADMGTSVNNVDTDDSASIGEHAVDSADDAGTANNVNNDGIGEHAVDSANNVDMLAEGTGVGSVADGVSDVTVHPVLDGDDASITNMRITRVSDGTAPFDGDDSRGNDSGDNNGVVRSFDRVTYMVSFSITPDDQLDYYTRVRVGFRVRLKVPKDDAVVDLGLFNWKDDSDGFSIPKNYEPVMENDEQVYTVYRLFEPSSAGENVAPGTYELPFAVNIRGMSNGETIAPVFEAFAVPENNDEPSSRVASVNAAPVRVSSRPSFNLRLSSSIGDRLSGSSRTFDWSVDRSKAMTDSDGLHAEFGKMKGVLSTVRLELALRQEDTNKGLRGLEVPKPGEPLKFDVEVSNWYTKIGGSDQSKVEDLQPYYWGVISTHTWQGVSGRAPSNQNWAFPDSDSIIAFPYNPWGTWQRAAHNSGVYTIDEERTGDKTIFHVTVNDWSVDVNKFPYMATSNWSTDMRCSTSYMDSTCTNMHTGSVSIAQMFMFSPTTMSDGTDVLEYYGNNPLTFNQTVDLTNMQVVSMDGNTITEQAIRTDDHAAASGNITPSGSFDSSVLYSCAEPGVTSFQGASCSGWGAHDASHGSDVALPGSDIRVGNGYFYSNSNSNQKSPVFNIELIKFDDKVIYATDDLSVSRPTANGQTWGQTSIMGTFYMQSYGDYNVTAKPIVQYAVKPDGTGWESDAEQGKAGLDDLVYYDSYDDAVKHGTIVGILIQSFGVAPIDRVRYMNASVLLHVKKDAPIGYTAQLTHVSASWTRDALEEYSGLDSDDSITEWEEWGNKQVPMEIRKTVKPTYEQNDGSKYRKAKYDSVSGYMAGETTGQHYGDTLYIAGEKPIIGITTEQSKSDGSMGKDMYDLDKGQRYADYLITPSVTSNEGVRGTTTATIQVTLPKGMNYVDASSMYGGDYSENNRGQLPGTVKNGKELVPVITRNSNGSTTLKYTIPDVPINGDDTPIRLTAMIGDTNEPDNDVKDGQQLVVSATIQTDNCKGVPYTENRTKATSTIMVSKTRAQQLSTRATPLWVEIGNSIGFVDHMVNASTSDMSNAIMMNASPVNGIAGSSFKGTLLLEKVQYTGKGVSLNGARVFYTSDPKIGTTTDLTTLTKGEVTGWTETTLNTDGTVELPTDVTAFGLLVPALPAGASIDTTIQYKPTGVNSGAIMVNRYSDLDNQVIAMSSIVNRSLNGIVFIDGDKDGARSSSDTVLGNTPVILVNPTTKQPITLLDGTIARTTTDDNGYYEFNSIPAGAYSVMFTPEPSEWRLYRTTVKQAENVNPMINSDADPVNNGNTLDGAIINTVTFPQLASMNTSRFTNDHQDVGLIRIDTSPTMPVTGQNPTIIMLATTILTGLILGIILTMNRARKHQ